jgi:hypothetical protein
MDNAALCFGWTRGQIAAAKNRCKEELPASMDGLMELRKWWDGRFPIQPLEVEIIGAPKPSQNDVRWAIDAFHSTQIRCK